VSQQSWTISASCAEMDPRDFTYVRKDEPGYIPVKGKNTQGKWVELGEKRANHERLLEAASKVCTTCPVFQECLDSATPADRFWTTRGGLTPLATVRPLVKQPTVSNDKYFEWECKEHGRRYVGKRKRGMTKGRIYCVACADGSGKIDA
jgi:transcription factor WhiB